MLVTVETLQNLVIFEMIRNKYKESRLPGLVSKSAFVSRRYDKRYPVLKYEQMFYKERDKICENWIIPGNMKKHKILLGFKAIVLEILEFAKELAQALKRFEFRVKFCIERICVTQVGRIDKAKTMLTIMKDSQFLYDFFHDSLFPNMIMTKDIISTSEEVLDSIKNSTDCDRVVKIKAAISDMLKLYFMDMMYIANEYATEGRTSNVTTAFFSLFRTRNYEGVRKLCELMNLDNRRKFLNDHNSKRWFSLKMSRLDGEMIQYLYLNLTSEEWKEALQISLNYYLKVLIYDWRCGEFAVFVFKYGLEADIIDINNIIFMFSLGHMMNIENDYEDQFAEEYDTLCWTDNFMADTCINILKEIWHNTPMELRNDMKEHILQSDDIRHINAESLMSIVDSYPIDDQGRIISKLMDDINTRGFADYKTTDYNKLYTMYLSLMSKSNNEIVVNNDIVTKFLTYCGN